MTTSIRWCASAAFKNLGAAEPRYVLQLPEFVEHCVGLYVPLLEFNLGSRFAGRGGTLGQSTGALRGTLGADWPSAAKSDKKDDYQPGWPAELYHLRDVTDQGQAVSS